MQQFSHETRDTNGSNTRVSSLNNNVTNKVIDDFDNEYTRNQRQTPQERTVEIIAQNFHTIARLEETGEYDNYMKEWTVYFLEKDQSSLCSVKGLNGLEIRVGDRYSMKFSHDVQNVQVGIHNVENEGEKSLVFTVGTELVVLGRILGYPEERSPLSDDDTVYKGDLCNLLTLLESEEMLGLSVSFGCIVFKECLLKEFGSVGEEEKSNWETFE